MATTSFDKNFSVPKEKETEFVDFLSKKPTPKNEDGYKTQQVSVTEIRKELLRALS